VDEAVLLRNVGPGPQRNLDGARRNAFQRGAQRCHQALLVETRADALFWLVSARILHRCNLTAARHVSNARGDCLT
jgi:hypothetical protein